MVCYNALEYVTRVERVLASAARIGNAEREILVKWQIEVVHLLKRLWAQHYNQPAGVREACAIRKPPRAPYV